MRKSVVKRKLRNEEPVLFYTLHVNDPGVWEMASLLGVDGLWMDMEHHSRSLETAGALCRAARVGTSDVMARPAKGEYMRMARLLELGANGILYPRCTSAQEAREVVQWAKFAPMGTRGADGANADQPYCSMDLETYTRVANEETFLFIQIEDDAGLNEVERIAQLEGVDGVMLGPGDYSVLGGFPGDFDHPRLQNALQRIGRAAAEAGKAWGTTTGSAQAFKPLYEAGARLIFSGADILAIKSAIKTLEDEWRSCGVSFNDQLTSRN